MSNTLKVRPKDDVQVRKEDGSLMPEAGCDVPNNTYYRRRLRDGDLIDTQSKAKKGGAK